MAARDDGGAGLGAARVLDGDEVQGVLTGSFYRAPPESARTLKAERDSFKAKPTQAHRNPFTSGCSSMYRQSPLGRWVSSRAFSRRGGENILLMVTRSSESVTPEGN